MAWIFKLTPVFKFVSQGFVDFGKLQNPLFLLFADIKLLHQSAMRVNQLRLEEFDLFAWAATSLALILF
jgi:hypothetical protein